MYTSQWAREPAGELLCQSLEPGTAQLAAPAPAPVDRPLAVISKIRKNKIGRSSKVWRDDSSVNNTRIPGGTGKKLSGL